MNVTGTINKPAEYVGRGRPHSLTQELQTKICGYIKDGNYLITACRAVGISDDTFRTWLERGDKERQDGNTDGLFSRFLSAVKEAEAASEIELVKAVQVHNKRNVVAPLALLDRRFRERWGQTPAVAQGGNTYNFNIDKAVITASQKFDELMKRYEEPGEQLAIPGTGVNE